MPILFAALFFWSAPSGLVVYWMAGNIISIVQQLIINRMLPPLPAGSTTAGNSATDASTTGGKDKKRFNPRPA
jgi:YidC/Oxa1 family membrane protein insertase